jgi:uncharacterized OB-fold protein
MTDVVHLVDAAVVRPVRRHHGVAVEGPDEDALTLAVEAAGRLRPLPSAASAPLRIAKIHLVGAFGAEAEKMIPIALGLPGTPVERASSESPAIETFLVPIARAGEGALLLVAERSRWSGDGTPESGAVGIALWFHPDGPIKMGVTVPPESPHQPPPRRPPTAALSFEALLTAMSQLPLEVRSSIPGHATWEAARAPSVPELGALRSQLPVDLDVVSEGAYVPAPRYWEHATARWRFAAEECAACGSVTFPPQGRCHQCADRTHLRPVELPFDGVVDTVTTVHAGAQPSEFDGPVEIGGSYDVAVVRLTPTIRLPLQVTDAVPGTLRIGDRVTTTLRRLYPMDGTWRYGRKAIPVRAVKAE